MLLIMRCEQFYGASGVEFSEKAAEQIDRYESLGYVFFLALCYELILREDSVGCLCVWLRLT